MRFIITIILICAQTLIAFSNGVNGLDNLMPVPTSVVRGEGKFRLNTTFELAIQGETHARVYGAATRFIDRLTNKTGLFLDQGIIRPSDSSESAPLQIFVTRPGKVELGEAEQYSLEVDATSIRLSAETDIGIIRGFQTLFQLTSIDEEGYYFPVVKIEDAPRFQWRGLMIDVSRHFQPIEVIKRNLDGMEAVKLNILHLHLSDDHGYRLASKAYPKLNDIASDGQYYTFEEIRTIVAYADERGIRVMPEIDVPGHATAILAAYPELGSKDTTYTLIRNSGIFDATLNPTIDKTYTFLDELFGEVSQLFPDPYFHIGGDENEGKHWDENMEIQAFMKERGIKDNHQLQAYFNIRLSEILKKYNKTLMGWEEIQSPDMPEGTVIHSWRGANQGVENGASLFAAADSGFKTVLSNGYYIDLLYKGEDHYRTDPYYGRSEITEQQRENILGGEATMWSELVTPLSIDTRIWPRLAAIAERLWSPASVKDVRDMYRRLEFVSLWLEHYGLQHIRGQETILRNLSNSTNIEPLKVLVNVIEPLKSYHRNPGGRLYNVFSPYTLLADAATADAPDARKLQYLIEAYADNRSDVEYYSIVEYFDLWIQNDDQIQSMAKTSPVLKQALLLSANLKSIAQIGKEAIDYYRIGDRPSKKWYTAAHRALDQAKEQSGRTELQVVDPIATLVEMTQPAIEKTD